MRITNAMGVVVAQASLMDGQGTLSLKSLPAGVYFVQVNMGEDVKIAGRGMETR